MSLHIEWSIYIATVVFYSALGTNASFSISNTRFTNSNHGVIVSHISQLNPTGQAKLTPHT